MNALNAIPILGLLEEAVREAHGSESPHSEMPCPGCGQDMNLPANIHAAIDRAISLAQKVGAMRQAERMIAILDEHNVSSVSLDKERDRLRAELEKEAT